jgi:O-antigen/teichoic acid export membrane protein
VRLILKDSERRPDPAPVVTDDRKPMLIGIGIWIVALALILVFDGPLTAAGDGWWLWACVGGIVLGLVGVFYTHWRRKRS